MDSGLLGSALEMLILEVIAQGPSYGYEIAQTVAGRSDGTFAMKEGSEKLFGKGYNILPVWKERLNANTQVTTPNSDVIYAMGHLSRRNGTPPLALLRRRDPPHVHVLTDALQLGDAGLGLEGCQQLPHALGVIDRI